MTFLAQWLSTGNMSNFLQSRSKKADDNYE
jgi:hypothetical protein